MLIKHYVDCTIVMLTSCLLERRPKKNGFNRVVEPSMVYALDLLLIGDDVEEADSR